MSTAAQTASQTRQVIPHPIRRGFWTILIGDRIYGEFDRRELAIAIMLTR